VEDVNILVLVQPLEVVVVTIVVMKVIGLEIARRVIGGTNVIVVANVGTLNVIVKIVLLLTPGSLFLPILKYLHI